MAPWKNMQELFPLTSLDSEFRCVSLSIENVTCMKDFTAFNNQIILGLKTLEFCNKGQVSRKILTMLSVLFSIENILVSSKLLNLEKSLDKDGISDQKEREERKKMGRNY